MRPGGMPSTSRPFLRSGGWVVLAVMALTTAAFAWHIAGVLSSRSPLPRGDGRTVASYGFPLHPSTVPADLLTPSGLPRDGVQVLDAPAIWSLEDLERASGRHDGKLLVPGDRVAGLVVHGQARAYPLRFLVWHEAVNDTLGGIPVLVTYHPLSGSVAAFSRRVGDTTLDFGFSGLLYQSSPLLYDRRSRPRDESLWSQLLQAAVAGPAVAAGDRLEVLPVCITTWREWLRRQPSTTLLAPRPDMVEKYGREPYASYFGSDELRFPAAPLPPHGATPLKAPVAVVFLGGRRWVVPLALAASRADDEGTWSTELGGVPVRITAGPGATVAVSDAAGRPLPCLLAFTFAWYATHATDPATTWLAPPR